MRRFKWCLVVLILGLASLPLFAQDTIALDAVNVSADRIAREVLNPLVTKKVDSLIL